MEAHRLKPMVSNYDPAVFNDLYERTKNLRRSLVKGIDCRRFGVDQEEMLSWFDVKFIFVFNKYYHKFNPEILLGHIINALKLYKYRVLRQAYTDKSMLHQQTVPMEVYHHVDEDETLPELVDSSDMDSHSYHYNLLKTFLQSKLSPDAFFLFELELNPAPFIIRRMNEEGCKNLQKIPEQILLEYFELGLSRRASKYIQTLREEIKMGISASKQYFKRN